MIAELKRLHSPDICNLQEYKPEDALVFSIHLQVMVGLKGQEGEESFDLEVCSPQWLEKMLEPEDIIIGRHYLIMQHYSYERLFKFIDKFVQRSSGHNWDDIVNRLSALGRWEFEDYQPYVDSKNI